MHGLLLPLLLAVVPADATVSAAFAEPNAALTTGTALSTGSGAMTYAIPLAILALLGGGAAWAARRKAIVPRHLHVLESASLGPKRGLALVDIGGERLLLASSEAGVTLLRVLVPTGTTAHVTAPVGAGSRDARASRSASASARPQDEAPSPFESLLADSAEDQELRAKLAAGFRARTS